MVTMAMVSVAMVKMAFSREARPKVLLRVGDGGWHRDGGPDESRLWCEKDFGLRQNANWEEAMLGPIPSYFFSLLGTVLLFSWIVVNFALWISMEF